MSIFLLVITAYLIGSFPTAYLMGRLVKGIDLREHGSGNVGATNVMRVLGTGPGIVTLLIDLLKGFVVVYFIAPAFCRELSQLPLYRILSCVAVIVGHNWMIFLKFKGGKGVATSGGAFLALSPLAVLSAIAVFGLVVAVSRYVSLGSILGSLSLPLFMWVYVEDPRYICFAALIAAGLVVMHRGNIRRLLKGTESRIGGKNKGEKEPG